jgi:hypothetical protein
LANTPLLPGGDISANVIWGKKYETGKRKRGKMHDKKEEKGRKKKKGKKSKKRCKRVKSVQNREELRQMGAR